MGDSVVIGVRIPKWVKEELEKLDINYAKEIREFLLNRIREEKMKRLAVRMDEIRRRAKSVEDNLSAKVIRESRDESWTE